MITKSSGRKGQRSPQAGRRSPQPRSRGLAVRVALSVWLLLALTVAPGAAQAAAAPASGPAGIEVSADAWGLPLADDSIARSYPKASVLLEQGDRVEFTVAVPQAGEYTLHFDAAADPAEDVRPEGQLQIDGGFPLNDLRRIIFPVYYQNVGSTFPRDRYGNDALIRQERLVRWAETAARDVDFSQSYPLRVPLDAGEHRFVFTLTQQRLYLGSVYVRPFTPLPDYSAYLAAHPVSDAQEVLITQEAEFPAFKNDTSVRPDNSRSLAVTPYDTYRLLLNTLGGKSWQKSGSTVYYAVTAPSDGFYTITFHAQQNTRSNFTVFRRITVNGDVPFEQLNQFPFPYSSDWIDVTLGGDQPYKIFLTQGENLIGLEATNAPYAGAIGTMQQALLDINQLALEIKKLTGNQPDRYKEWVISDYIPDIQPRLQTIIDHLRSDKELLLTANQGQSSPEILTYQLAIDNLVFLAQDPNKIPVYLNRFSEGSGSAAQLLGSLIPQLQSQPLALDKLTVHSPDRVLPAVETSWGQSLSENFKRFIRSFRSDPYRSLGASDDELEVWVNRPRQYVDLLQLMADETFTPQTDIRVKFSIMPDENKLVLANAAGIQPDVALGVSTGTPYELAIRNALYDLRSFDDFDSFIGIYSPGALLSYIINDSVYAIPETQDFWVTYYRHDILDSLGLPVPHTWNEVIELLPELQRYGMNFNTPLSNGGGFKPYLMTAPYLFNQGAVLYSADGFSTGLQSEESIAAIKFMADSFTLYGMPLTTASFYESFRYGSLPLGVANFTTYVQLMTAAPEIDGLWSMTTYPATVLADGAENRYATGSAQASMMFANTNKAQQGWQFLKWWMSTETQIAFQERLILSYGREYLWNSANLEAFSRLAIPQEHKDVILEQWRWLQEPVKLPGSYMQERELSNVWNRIVFDGVNPRVAIDNSVVVINREITRKMTEFGYIQNGQRVREFKIPTLATVKGWMDNAR